jgi:hypothetical protein
MACRLRPNSRRWRSRRRSCCRPARTLGQGRRAYRTLGRSCPTTTRPAQVCGSARKSGEAFCLLTRSGCIAGITLMYVGEAEAGLGPGPLQLMRASSLSAFAKSFGIPFTRCLFAVSANGDVRIDEGACRSLKSSRGIPRPEAERGRGCTQGAGTAGGSRTSCPRGSSHRRAELAKAGRLNHRGRLAAGPAACSAASPASESRASASG